MRRYVAFVAMNYEARGGWEDVLMEDAAIEDSSTRSFDSAEEAAVAARKAVAGEEKTKYWHVVDLHTGKIVLRGGDN